MPSNVPQRPNDPRCDLRIVATSDLHVHIMPHDYYTDRPAPGSGLAHAAGLISGLRAEVANSLLLDNGDFLQGSAMGDYAAEACAIDDCPHPMIAAMNLLGYDAAALGNHEFNYGLPFLRRVLAEARFPVVSANTLTADGQAQMFAPHVMLDRRLRDRAGQDWPIRIAVIGFLPPQVTTWDRAHLVGHMTTAGIVQAARDKVPGLRAAGADLVVALCHSGIGDGSDDPDSEDAALAVAQVPGVDAVVAGHTHQVFPGPDFDALALADNSLGLLAGVPACMPGSAASHVGVIDLVLCRTVKGWRVDRGAGRVLPVADVAHMPPDPNLLQTMAPHHAGTRAHLRRAVGAALVPLHTQFAVARESGVQRLVAAAQRWRAQQALAGTALADLPLLSATAPLRAGGRSGPDNFTDLPAGSLLLRHLADLCPYPNTLRVLRLSGADVANWLERAAGVFAQVTPGVTDQPLLSVNLPAYNFDLIDGLRYRIDPSRPARFDAMGRLVDPEARRIRDLRHAGRAVRPQDEFLVVTNNYRAAGGGGFPGCRVDAVVHRSTASLRSDIEAFLRATGPYAPPAEPVWRFADLPGTAAQFDAGPRATDHLPVPGLTALGPTSEGFTRMRLDF